MTEGPTLRCPLGTSHPMHVWRATSFTIGEVGEDWTQDWTLTYECPGSKIGDQPPVPGPLMPNEAAA